MGRKKRLKRNRLISVINRKKQRRLINTEEIEDAELLLRKSIKFILEEE